MKPVKKTEIENIPVPRRVSRGIRHNRSPRRDTLPSEFSDDEIRSDDEKTADSAKWDESFGQCCRMIELAIRRSSPAEAHAALDRFLAAIAVREAVTLDSPVALLQFVGDCSLDVREINMLERNGVVTVRSFLAVDDQGFLMMRDCSMSRLEKFRLLKDQLVDELVRCKPRSVIERILGK